MRSHHEHGEERPEAWAERRRVIRGRWMVPFVWLEHKMDWMAYLLARWSLLKVLAYLESFGVLIAVVFYFSESGDRLKQKHYQAWQVINSAQGKGGNGGRIEALETLNADGVPLVGVDLSSAFLVGVRLPKANLNRADFEGADARNAVMAGSTIEDASLQSANFREANLEGTSLQRSVLDDVDFTGADLKGTDMAGISLKNADLRNANLERVKWMDLKAIQGTDIRGVKNAPPGFLKWALAHGAVKKEE